MGYIVQDNNHIYYKCFENDRQYLCKADFDGKNKVVLYEGRIYNFNIYNSCIYFIDLDDFFVYKIGIDGNNLSKVLSKQTNNIMIWKDKLYYNDLETNYIYAYGLNDSSEEIVLNVPISSFFIHDDYIIYETLEGNRTIHKYSLENKSDKAYVVDDMFTLGQTYMYKDSLIFNVISRAGIEIIDLKTGNQKQLFSSQIPVADRSICIDEENGYMYFSTYDKKFYRLDLETHKTEEIFSAITKGSYFINDRIFYYEDAVLKVVDVENNSNMVFGE